jgi:stringent starvation protein B
VESGSPLPGSKREALEALLSKGLVMIHLDARRPEVVVPVHLSQDPHLRLNLSNRFGLSDLEIDDWGVRVTLSFRGQGIHCRVPWMALFAMTQDGGERGWLWPHDLPPELLDSMQAAVPEAGSPGPTKPSLRLVPPGDGVAGGAPRPEPPDEAPPPPSRPHLRLVK